jgi:hypothetical protein
MNDLKTCHSCFPGVYGSNNVNNDITHFVMLKTDSRSVNLLMKENKISKIVMKDFQHGPNKLLKNTSKKIRAEKLDMKYSDEIKKNMLKIANASFLHASKQPIYRCHRLVRNTYKITKNE